MRTLGYRGRIVSPDESDGACNTGEKGFVRSLPVRRPCRLLVTVDCPCLPRLATATRRHADHPVDGPFICLLAPVCGAVFAHARQTVASIAFGRQRLGLMCGQCRT